MKQTIFADINPMGSVPGTN